MVKAEGELTSESVLTSLLKLRKCTEPRTAAPTDAFAALPNRISFTKRPEQVD
jgi:hypothetical protein